MKIFDPLRRKYVECTPEEEVRQSVIAVLAEKFDVPKHLMASEYSFKFGKLEYRADILVFDRNLEKLMLVECKRPDIILDNNVIDQVVRYNNVLNVKYILITNGKSSYLCRRNDEGAFEPVSRFPSYKEMCND